MSIFMVAGNQAWEAMKGYTLSSHGVDGQALG